MNDHCEHCGVSHDEHDTPAKTCERLDVATKMLQSYYDSMCFSDSYGVPGSEFMTCTACGAGGSPYRRYVHTAECPMRAVEAFLYGSDMAEANGEEAP